MDGQMGRDIGAVRRRRGELIKDWSSSLNDGIENVV